MADQLHILRPRQRAVTAITRRAGSEQLIIPARHVTTTVMTAALGVVDKSGFSSPVLFTFGAMSSLPVFGFDIAQVTNDISDANTEIVFASTPGELAEDFWYSVTFKSADPLWDGFTLLREDNAAFNNAGATFTIWSFLNRNVPFIDGETYVLTWRRQ